MGSVSESVFRHAHCPVLVVYANRSTRRLSEFLGPFTDYATNWSPDGSKIAFHSEQAGNRDIYVMDPDRTTDDVTRLTKKAVDDAWAAWSPDGKRIAFASERGSGFADIFVMKPRPESSKNRPKNLTKPEDDVANFKADWQPIPPPP
jgi:Tol biopolymer transport system component